MKLLQLFITASVPVLKLLLITGLGAYLARDGIDILGEDARKHLNTVSCSLIHFYVVSQALLIKCTVQSLIRVFFVC